MSSTIENELQDAMLPLWLQFPDLPRYSIGWRMGSGEEYAWKFSDWWDKLSVAAQQEYEQRYPEPVGWSGWYRDEDLDEEEDEEVNDRNGLFDSE
jgi:hypothetical protein